MPNITVSHIVSGEVGVAGDASPALTLELELDRISVDELIARTVERQIAVFEESAIASSDAGHAMLDRCWLGETESEVMVVAGCIAMPGCRGGVRAAPIIDPALEIERARSAFAAGHYRVFVDGQELLALDDEVSLEKVASARFQCEVPPAGG